MKYRLLSLILVFTLIFTFNHLQVFAIPQETTLPSTESVINNDVHKIKKYSINNISNSNMFISLLQTFIYDIEAHPESTAEQLLNAIVGEPFQIAKIDQKENISINKNIYFIPIIYKSKVYAIVDVVIVDDEFNLTISNCYIHGINKLLKNSKSGLISLLFTDNQLLGVNETTVIDIISTNEIKSTNITDNEKNFKQVLIDNKMLILDEDNIGLINLLGNTDKQSDTILHIMSKTTVPYNTGTTRGQVVLSNYPTFSQGSDPTCWAGTIASMIKYELYSIYPNVTINTITNYIGSTSGTWENIMDALNHYFTSPYLPSQTTYFSKSTVKTVIGNNDPAYMQASNPSKTEAHATALCGYDENGSNFSVRIMDPGTGTLKWGNTSTSTTGPYTYQYNGSVFTWENSVRLYYI